MSHDKAIIYVHSTDHKQVLNFDTRFEFPNKIQRVFKVTKIFHLSILYMNIDERKFKVN